MRRLAEIERPLRQRGILLRGRLTIVEGAGCEQDVMQLDLAADALRFGQCRRQLQSLARQCECVVVGKKPEAQSPGGHQCASGETGVLALRRMVRQAGRSRQVVPHRRFEQFGDAPVHDAPAQR